AVAAVPEFLDEAEDVVPAPAIEPRGMLAQLEQNLVHFERGQYCLNEHGRLDRAALHAQCILCGDEDIVPQPGFETVLDFRQVEIGAGAGSCQGLVVARQKDREIEQRLRYRLAVHVQVLAGYMPSAPPRVRVGVASA